MSLVHRRLALQIAVIAAGLAVMASGEWNVAPADAQQDASPAADRPDRVKLRGPAQDKGGKGRGTQAVASPREAARQNAGGEFRTDVPEHPFDLILARPTSRSIALSALAYQDLEGYVACGTEPAPTSPATPPRAFKEGRPEELVIDALRPGARYYYAFCSRRSADEPFQRGPEATFHTARPPGSPFTFTVTADSHLDEQTEPALYRQTLVNALADTPDFHIDLGDTFMSEKHASRESAAKQYLAQRYYFGLLCHSAPLYLVLGNHDGEGGRYVDGTGDSLTIWSNGMRKKYFPNPDPAAAAGPDGFYTGSDTPAPFAGSLQNYFAWEWGGAQFIVLDPFWYAPRPSRGGDNWTRTLGVKQYEWLRRTLQASHAKLKFVFIHHLVGGADNQSRGGVEAAPFFEWGGKNADGSDGFQQHRPGWPAPIHQLLKEAGVSIVFHGHDHLFAKQDLDGIVYQESPQPGLRRYNVPRTATEYGYVRCTILGGPGHLRVTVSPDRATVDFVSSRVPEDETVDHRNREVRFSYTVP